MANKKLVLDAELKDGISGKIRKINKELQTIDKTEGMKSMDGWFGKLGREAEGFVKSSTNVSGIFSAMGIGGLAAGASVEGLTRAMAALGNKQADLAELGRQIKMLPDDLNRLAKAAEYLRVPEQAMKGLMGSFAGQMPEFKRSVGAMFQEMSGIPGFLDNIYGKMKNENLGDAMLDGLRVAEKVWNSKGGPQQAKKLLEQMFPGHGDDAMKLIGNGHLDEYIKRIEQMKTQVDPINPEFLKAQKEFNNSVVDMNHAIENFENSAGPAFLKTLTGIVQETKDFFDTLHGKEDPKAPKSFGSRVADALKPGPVEHAAMSIFQSLRGKDFLGASREALKPHELSPEDQALQRALQDKAKAQSSPYGSLLHKSSYEGSNNGLLHNTAYVEDSGSPTRTSGASSELLKVVTMGTRAGVLAAFQDWDTLKDVKGGVHNASYETGDGGGSGGGGGGGGGRRGFMRRGRAGGGGGGYDGPLPAGSSAHNLTDLIAAESKRAGLDPRIMEGIRAGESGHSSRYDHNAGTAAHPEDSWGPYQLNRRKGLGVMFEHDTAAARSKAGFGGLEDPRTIPMQTRWVAEYIKKHGRGVLSNWFGYHGDRDASPRWGDSGYVPGKDSEIASAGKADGIPGDIGSRLKVLKNSGFLGRGECVDLARQFVGAPGSVTTWERGNSATDGSLKAGTPIATFLDAHGNISDRYAGGGVGTRGINKDHAAVFESYIRDKNGRVIGMKVVDQSRGHNPHEHDIMMGDRRGGEKSMSNYFAIKRHGQYLGGMNNPMNRMDEPKVASSKDVNSHHHHSTVDVNLSVDKQGLIQVSHRGTANKGNIRTKLKTMPTMRQPSWQA